MEVFYTFTWAPRPRHPATRPERAPRTDRAPRPDRAPRRDAAAAVPADGSTPVVGDAAPVDAKPDGARRDRRNDRPNSGGADKGGFKGKPKFDGNRGDRNDRGGKPGNFPPRGKDQGEKGQKTYETRPPRVEKPIDPDNPFAVLAALKLKP